MSTTSILERCLSILEVLAEEPAGISLGNLSAQAGIPKSAAHRMLGALIDSGFVAQSDQTRQYRLTMKLVTLGFRFLGETGLIDECQAILDRVAAEVQELVRMTIVDGDRLMWVSRAQGARGSLVIDPVTGREVALHATASGKAWLASLPEEHALRLVMRDGFGTQQQHGPNVIQTVEDLRSTLKLTREQGYAMSWEEAEPGIAALAVGVGATPDAHAPLVGTISVAGPTFRLSKEVLTDYYPLLRDASLQLSDMGSVLRYWRDHVRTPGSHLLAKSL